MFPKIQRAALGWVVPQAWTILILLCLRLLPWRKYNKKEVGEGVIQQLGSAGNRVNLRDLPDAIDFKPVVQHPSPRILTQTHMTRRDMGYTQFWQPEIFLRE
jgi:hypothetical protein